MTSQDTSMLQLLTKTLQAGQWCWEPLSNAVQGDQRFNQLLSLPTNNEPTVGLSAFWTHHCHPDDRIHLEDQINHAVQSGRDLDLVFRITPPEGVHHVRVLAVAALDDQGGAAAFDGLIYVHKERELEQKVEMLESVLANIPGQVFWKDKDLHYLGCNKVFCETVGLDRPQDVVGKTDFDLQPNPKHAHIYRDDDIRIMEKGQAELDIEEPFQHSDGREGVLLTSKVPLVNKSGTIYGILGICTDITLRVTIEKKLAEQKKLFEELVDLVPVMVNSFDRDGTCRIWNKTCEDILGYRFEEAQSEPNLMEIFYPDPEIREQVILRIQDPDGEFRAYPVVVRNGATRQQLWSNFKLSNGMMIGCGIDMTDLKETEHKLNIEKQRFLNVIDNMPLGYHLFELNDEGALVFTDYNRAADSLLGIDHAPYKNQLMLDAFPSVESMGIHREALNIAQNGGTFSKDAIGYKDDKIDSVFSTLFFRCYPGAVASIFNDISAIRLNEIKLEDALRKLKLVTEGSQDGFWHWLDPEKDLAEWSDRFYTLLGYEPGELKPNFTLFQSMLHPDDLERTLEEFNRAIQERTLFDIQYRIRSKSGEYRWYRGRGKPYYSKEGAFTDMAGSISDINERKQLEGRLFESNQRYQLAVEAVGVGIWTWDMATNKNFWSPAFFDLLGLENNEVEGSFDEWESRLHPDDKGPVFAILDAHLKHNQPYDVEFRMLCKNGQYHWFKSIGKALRAEDGTPLSMAGSLQDTHQKKIAEQQREQLISKLAASNEFNAAILNSSIQLVISTDLNGIVSQFNVAAEITLGYQAQDVIGKETPALWHDLDEVIQHAKILSAELGKTIEPGFEVFVVKARTEGLDRNEWTFIRKDGSRFPVVLTVTCIRTHNDEITGYLGVIEDITERKKAEKEREELIHLLRASNRELDEFAYIASHDLKAPLRVIDNASSWLVEDLGDSLDEDSKENLQMVRNRAVRMEKLLDDLLEYSRIGRKTDERYQAQVTGDVLLQDVLLLVNKPAGFDIKIGPGFAEITLTCMPLQQIFINLINNAIKHHNGDRGTVVVDVQEHQDHYLFTVQDDGPGIAPEYHEKIFGMFQTLKSRDRVEGSGMGLAMVKKHAEANGAVISIDSEVGKGSTFQLTWPKHPKP